MLTKFILSTICLTGTIAIVPTLPSLAQTSRYTTVKSPTIVRPITNRSSANFNSKVGSQSRTACFQVDANSKIYVRNNRGGIRYYPGNNPSSYTQASIAYPRCN
jgi:hypothetical protein